MFKRLRWMTLGGAMGLGASVWVQRRLRRLTQRYAPIRGAASAMSAARQARRDVTRAWRDGRRQMHEHETRLRDAREQRLSQRRRRIEQRRRRSPRPAHEPTQAA